MEFKSNSELEHYLSCYPMIGLGATGTCYQRKSNKDVMKVFHYYDERDYSCEETRDSILRFSDIDNKTFMWPTDVITVNGVIVGYTSPYVKADSLYTKNPLSVNLNNLASAIEGVKKDISVISQEGVLTYDVPYNTLYSRKFYIIDHDEYTFCDIDSSELEKQNNRNFDAGIYEFLVDGYFERVINDDRLLSELYKEKKEDVLEFLGLFRSRLSELSGKEVSYLRDASELRDEPKEKDGGYIRIFKKDSSF